MERARISDVRRALLAWYDAGHRRLPWRGSSDAYAVWVSEIMLQQTRVAAVVEHYRRFLAKYPTVLSLSLAPLDDVLAAWSGLGYYRRARMLHDAARMVVSLHGGSLPSTMEGVRKLPGVGAYTSAAIASIAFGQPVAAVDGNVERVLARIEGRPGQRGAAHWRILAQTLLDKERPGDFNQAVMELGAVVCTPRRPACDICPVYQWCRTRGEHVNPPRPQMRSRQTAAALLTRHRRGGVQALLERRADNDSQMPGMWELPPIPEREDNAETLLSVRHAITNTNYYVRIYQVESADELPEMQRERRWLGANELATFPLTGLALKVLRRAGIVPTA